MENLNFRIEKNFFCFDVDVIRLWQMLEKKLDAYVEKRNGEFSPYVKIWGKYKNVH